MADTPDQRPDDTAADLDRSELPSALWPLHERLIADGSRWRRRAPDGRDLPSRARAMLLDAATTAESSNGGPHERRLDAHDERLSRPKGSRPHMDSPHTPAPTRWRGFAGAAAAAVVVGLLAALLAHNASQRGTGAAVTGTPAPQGCPAITQPPEAPQPTAGPIGCTPTPTPSNSQTFVQPAQLPVVAPSDTRIVYRVTISNVIQRSTDGGKQFTVTAQPQTGLSEVDFTGLAVSPLDARTVFFSAGGLKNGSGCPEPAAYGAMALHGGVLASGFIPCSAQLISTDGGQTWRALSLPTGGVLGGTQGFLAQSFAKNAQGYSMQAQGQRLYSAVAFASQGGTLVDSPGARLVASDDGGATWKLVDGALVQAGSAVCDFAAAPTGATIYATTSPGSCASETYPAITLWRSDDGGQNWQSIQQLPTLAEDGMVVSSQGWLYTFTPDVTVQGHGATITYTPASAKVSQDGGKTLSPAPSAGLPAEVNMQSGLGLAGPFATLSDGSVVYETEKSATPNSFEATLYCWRPGASAWTKISGSINSFIVAVVVSPTATGGDTLTAVTESGAIITLTTAQ